MREEFFDLSRRVFVDAGENVGEIGDGLDVIFLARGDERVKNGEVVTGGFVSNKEEVRSSECDAAQSRFRAVVVGRYRRKSQKSAEFAEISQ